MDTYYALCEVRIISVALHKIWIQVSFQPWLGIWRPYRKDERRNSYNFQTFFTLNKVPDNCAIQFPFLSHCTVSESRPTPHPPPPPHLQMIKLTCTVCISVHRPDRWRNAPRPVSVTGCHPLCQTRDLSSIFKRTHNEHIRSALFICSIVW